MRIAQPQHQSAIDFASLDLLPYGIIIVNADGVVVYYNSREEEIARRRREDVVGKNFFTDVAPCTQVAEFYGRFREAIEKSGLTASFRFRFPFAREPRIVDISLTGFRDEHRPMCLIGVRDLSEQDVVRQRILKAERLSEIGEVAATVAHNFNNVLMAIGTHTALVVREKAISDRGRRSLDQIEKSLKDAAVMVSRILQSTRQDATPAAMTEIDVDDLIREGADFARAQAESAGQRGASINVQTTLAAPPGAHVYGVVSELREAVANLVRNSIDAIPGEGTIHLSAATVGDQAFLEVEDDGEGMSLEVQEKLFRPLFTTKGSRGTGLGLSSVYAIVKRHGGEISLWSEAGRGTRFRVLLPLTSGSV